MQTRYLVAALMGSVLGLTSACTDGPDGPTCDCPMCQ